MQVTVKEKPLSDGSKVYDINFPGDFTLHAQSFRAAVEFCDEFTASVNKHTTASAGVTAQDEIRIIWL